MQIQFSSPELLIVELSASDMRALDLTYDGMDFADPRTRAVLTGFLVRYGIPEGFPMHHSRTVIEVFPTAGDGCVIFFSAAAGEPSEHRALRLRKIRPEPCVFEFDSAGDMMSAIDAISGDAGKILSSSLYRFGKGYRVVLRQKIPSRRTLMTMSEFGRLIGRGSHTAAHTAEFGQLLSSDAVGELGRFLS